MRVNKAFTLIELLAVIVIIAIIAIIGVFTVTKIIEKARVKSLSSTAVAVRKAVDLYLADDHANLPLNESFSLDLTPGNGLPGEDPEYIAKGEYANLMDLSKDPWDKDYSNVRADIVLSSDNHTIDIYFTLLNGDVWRLANGDYEVIKMIPLTMVEPNVGNALVGEQLIVGDLSPYNSSVKYQWQRADSENGSYVDIVGADSVGYSITNEDTSKYIRVKIMAYGDYVGTIYSEPTGPIKIPLTSIANITGNLTVGQTLTAGSVSPAGATVSYQWQKSSTVGGTYTNISGATGSTFVTTNSEKDYYIKLIVTGTGQYGSSAISQATAKIEAPSLDLLLVGGGGGGGFAYYGGGGGGGQCRQTTYTANPGSVTVTIGAGGAAATVNRASAGGTTSFGGITAIGGGGGGGGSKGGYGSSYSGGTGASGGGAAEQNTGGIGTAGFNGGSGGLSAWAGNGGGGAGGIGGSVPAARVGGAGGVGISSDISGTTQWYCGGGGGGASTTGGTGGSGVGGRGACSSLAASAPTANRGSGGGGAYYTTGTSGSAGVVIVRYITGTITATGGIITTSGAYTIHTFNTSGTFTIN